jgi:hypothetical protein
MRFEIQFFLNTGSIFTLTKLLIAEKYELNQETGT